jgi:hypothetical protein
VPGQVRKRIFQRINHGSWGDGRTGETIKLASVVLNGPITGYQIVVFQSIEG